MKTYEEVGEVISAIESNNKEELSDGIGDSIVTLINATWFLGEDEFKTLLVQKNDAYINAKEQFLEELEELKEYYNDGY